MKVLLSFLLLLGPVFAATTHAPAPSAAPRTAVKGPVLNDAALQKAVEARLAKSKISSDKFQVQVQGGIATLSGHTSIVQHKGVATRLAKLAGAKAVVNRIEISEEARNRAAANLAQGRRRLQIKRSDIDKR